MLPRAMGKKPPTPYNKRSPGTKPQLTIERFRRICATLSQTGQRYKSCEAHGFNYETARVHCKKKPEWQAMWEEALEQFRDNLEGEAFRRMFHGVEEPVFYKGQVVGYVTKYSDRLMEQRLRAELPNKYRDNLKVDATVKAGVLVVPPELSMEEWLERYGRREEDSAGPTG